MLTPRLCRILVDEESVNYTRGSAIKRRLLEASRPTNISSLDDVARICVENAGLCLDLDCEADVRFELGSRETVAPEFEVRDLLRYPCCERTTRLLIVGRLVFGTGRHEPLVVAYTAGDRCYVHSRATDALYIVSERGLHELLVDHGHRHVYEMFDARVSADDETDSGIPFSMSSLAACSDLREVEAVVRRRAYQSTFRLASRIRSGFCGGPRGYFIVGDERALGLAQFFPTRLFSCLADAGYRVVGRAEFGLVVLCNEALEVFILLDACRVLKVANTLPGFLRDRLRTNVQPFRRCFRPTGEDVTLSSVGQLRPFRCDVEYVLPGAQDFCRWLADLDEGGFVGIELRVPTV